MPSRCATLRHTVPRGCSNEAAHCLGCRCVNTQSRLSRCLTVCSVSGIALGAVLIASGLAYFHKEIDTVPAIEAYNNAVRFYDSEWAFGRPSIVPLAKDRKGSEELIVSGESKGNSETEGTNDEEGEKSSSPASSSPTSASAASSSGLMPMTVRALTDHQRLSRGSSSSQRHPPPPFEVVLHNSTQLRFRPRREFSGFDDDDMHLMYADFSVPAYRLLEGHSTVARVLINYTFHPDDHDHDDDDHDHDHDDHIKMQMKRGGELPTKQTIAERRAWLQQQIAQRRHGVHNQPSSSPQQQANQIAAADKADNTSGTSLLAVPNATASQQSYGDDEWPNRAFIASPDTEKRVVKVDGRRIPSASSYSSTTSSSSFKTVVSGNGNANSPLKSAAASSPPNRLRHNFELYIQFNTSGRGRRSDDVDDHDGDDAPPHLSAATTHNSAVVATTAAAAPSPPLIIRRQIVGTHYTVLQGVGKCPNRPRPRPTATATAAPTPSDDGNATTTSVTEEATETDIPTATSEGPPTTDIATTTADGITATSDDEQTADSSSSTTTTTTTTITTTTTTTTTTSDEATDAKTTADETTAPVTSAMTTSTPELTTEAVGARHTTARRLTVVGSSSGVNSDDINGCTTVDMHAACQDMYNCEDCYFLPDPADTEEREKEGESGASLSVLSDDDTTVVCPNGAHCGHCVHEIYLRVYCLVIAHNATTDAYAEDSRRRYCNYPFRNERDTEGDGSGEDSDNKKDDDRSDTPSMYKLRHRYIRVPKYGDPPPSNILLEVRSSDDPLLTLETLTEGSHTIWIDWPPYRPVGALLAMYGAFFIIAGAAGMLLLWYLSRRFPCCYAGVVNYYGGVSGANKNGQCHSAVYCPEAAAAAAAVAGGGSPHSRGGYGSLLHANGRSSISMQGEGGGAVHRYHHAAVMDGEGGSGRGGLLSRLFCGCCGGDDDDEASAALFGADGAGDSPMFFSQREGSCIEGQEPPHIALDASGGGYHGNGSPVGSPSRHSAAALGGGVGDHSPWDSPRASTSVNSPLRHSSASALSPLGRDSAGGATYSPTNSRSSNSRAPLRKGSSLQQQQQQYQLRSGSNMNTVSALSLNGGPLGPTPSTLSAYKAAGAGAGSYKHGYVFSASFRSGRERHHNGNRYTEHNDDSSGDEGGGAVGTGAGE